MATAVLQFEREALSDVTRMKVWTSYTDVLPAELFLYEYDNVTEAYVYSRVCRYTDLVNWRTARQGYEDRYIRKSYVYIEAYTDSVINEKEADIRSQFNELLYDVEQCTDGTPFVTTIQAGDYTVSGTGVSGSGTAKFNMSVWSGADPFPCLVLRNEWSGAFHEASGALLSVASIGDFDEYSTSGSGSGYLWRAASGTVLMPPARLSEFVAFLSGDLLDLSEINRWNGVEVSGVDGSSGTIYI